MRLTELAPTWRHWHHDAVADGALMVSDDDPTKAMGVVFDCPTCAGAKAHRCYIDFANPFDGAQAVVRKNLWQVSGDSFETLTLTPSVDYTKYDNGTVRDAGCWHGFITNGEVS